MFAATTWWRSTLRARITFLPGIWGLNFQIEHHLFPRICHVYYPAIAGIVEATCAEFGVR